MPQILKGKPVADAMNIRTKDMVESLKARGIQPALAILRVGAQDDDLSYERGAMKRCADLNIQCRSVSFERDVSEDAFLASLESLSQNPDVHAAMEILHFYGVDPCGKRAVVIGRSLVIGRPVAMMLMHENATVTLCHTRTKNMHEICHEAEILICASGQMESIGSQYLTSHQVVIDVGISWNEQKKKLCGDVRYEEVLDMVDAITPVPGGVGSVTTSVLTRHVVEAAQRMNT